jgi:hypothetical protein
MTKEEIIKMVKQTDLLGIIDSQYYENELWIPDVVEFAKLVAEKERKACARLCAEMGMWDLVHEIEARGQE